VRVSLICESEERSEVAGTFYQAAEHLRVILLWPARVKVSLRGTDEMIGVLALVFAIPLGSAFLWLEAIK